ncbi:hypothetical protein [Actinospica robiniae]|uniref:hypothetical protein n=1 Tax=Actinospica robiniae TaxID=304901 RepID=UPI0003FDF62C|nr:hypothetical protein [Actinospica robiniae]
MGYGPQEPYEPYEYGQYQPNPYEGGGEGYPEYPQPGYPQPEYQPYPEQAYQEQPYAEQPYQDPAYQEAYPADPAVAADPQWAMSGMGWEQRAWDEARLGVSPLQEYGQDQGGRQTDYESNAPGRGSRRRAAAPEHEREYDGYDEYGNYDEHGGYNEYGGYAEEPGASEVPQPRSGLTEPAEFGQPTVRQAPSPAAASAPGAVPAPGRGAFGAAGLGAILALAALASASAALVVIALVQLGVAYGWQLAAGLGRNGRGDRRSIVLTALIGWAASAAAFKLTGSQRDISVPVALGVGFLLLAADQTLRQRTAIGDGERITALAVSVAGAVFAALPAAFVLADRTDKGLTAACASAAAVGVLCCALLGRDPLRGILAAVVPGAAVGALAATSFSATGGLKAGAFGGAVAALAAGAGSGALDRMTAEGELRGSTRIVAQTLPLGLAAVGAVFATAVFR